MLNISPVILSFTQSKKKNNELDKHLPLPNHNFFLIKQHIPIAHVNTESIKVLHFG